MESPRPPSLDRRSYLARIGSAACVGALAGCAGDERTPTTRRREESTAGTATTRTTPGSAPATTTTAGTTARAESAATTPVFPGYETTAVVVETPAGERLGSVTAAVADTASLRYTGLSDTPALPEDRGMLFVFDSEGPHPFVMRGMEYGLDIVFAGADGKITKIHHAQAPGPGEDGDDQRYPGVGQYVLEVNLDWTTRRDVSAGDVLSFELSR